MKELMTIHTITAVFLVLALSCSPTNEEDKVEEYSCELVVANLSKEDIYPLVASEDFGVVSSEAYKSINIALFSEKMLITWSENEYDNTKHSITVNMNKELMEKATKISFIYTGNSWLVRYYQGNQLLNENSVPIYNSSKDEE